MTKKKAQKIKIKKPTKNEDLMADWWGLISNQLYQLGAYTTRIILLNECFNDTEEQEEENVSLIRCQVTI